MKLFLKIILYRLCFVESLGHFVYFFCSAIIIKMCTVQLQSMILSKAPVNKGKVLFRIVFLKHFFCPTHLRDIPTHIH